MLYRDYTATILDIDKKEIGFTKVDLQPYIQNKNYGNNDTSFDLELSHKIFCEVNDLIDDSVYFKIDNINYKVIRLLKYTNHYECWCYECEV